MNRQNMSVNKTLSNKWHVLHNRDIKRETATAAVQKKNMLVYVQQPLTKTKTIQPINRHDERFNFFI